MPPEERGFFSDTVTDADEDAFLRDALDDGDSSGDGERRQPDDENDQEASGSDGSDADDDDSDDEEQLDDGEQDDGDEEEGDDSDALPTPSADFDGWRDSLDDDERDFVDSLIAQAAESQEHRHAVVSIIKQADKEIAVRDKALRVMNTMLGIARLAATSPEGFQQFQRGLTQQQQRMAQMRQHPAQQELDNIKQGVNAWVQAQVGREQKENLIGHIRSGKPVTMDDGSKLTFKNLTGIEEQLLANARSEQEFDNALLTIHRLRSDRTQAARDTLRQGRAQKGADRPSVRNTGAGRGAKNNYDNYNPDNFDAYMDDVMAGMAG